MPSTIPDVAHQATARRLVDLQRYPIISTDTAEYKELIKQCRQQMEQLGACVLPGFIDKQATQDLAVEANTLSSRSYHSELTGNAYLTEIDPALSSDDPRTLTDRTALGVVAYDQMPQDALIRAIYEWDPLMDFLAAALGKERLYRYADPMGALNIAVMKRGDYLRWHFDQTDFVTSILLQSSEQGGDYEFVPMIRNKINENYEQVRAILKGSRDGIIRLEIEPGSLVLFEGRNSLHRVSPIDGDTLRLIALFGFDTKPGTQSSEYLRQIRYGRTSAIKLQ